MAELNDDLYQTFLLEEVKHPKNVGIIQAADAVNAQYNVACGDQIQVSLKLSTDKKKVVDIKWQGSGCAISTAAMSQLSQIIKGQTISRIFQLGPKEILSKLGLKMISPGRINCLTLGLKSVKQALADFVPNKS